LLEASTKAYRKKLETRASEERDRVGYAKRPPAVGEADLWGIRGRVASRIARGDVRLYSFAPPDKKRPVVVLEHFHFYSAQEGTAKCVFSWGKAASRLVALYTPEVKML
jgi:hypothetical protein